DPIFGGSTRAASKAILRATSSKPGLAAAGSVGLTETPAPPARHHIVTIVSDGATTSRVSQTSEGSTSEGYGAVVGAAGRRTRRLAPPYGSIMPSPPTRPPEKTAHMRRALSRI